MECCVFVPRYNIQSLEYNLEKRSKSKLATKILPSSSRDQFDFYTKLPKIDEYKNV
jgi:hypothetical protein